MSDNYNNLEKIIANSLRHFPQIKKDIKKLYQFINYFFYKKKYRFWLNDNYKMCSFSIGRQESFFGYYDTSPINIKSILYFYLSLFFLLTIYNSSKIFSSIFIKDAK